MVGMFMILLDLTQPLPLCGLILMGLNFVIITGNYRITLAKVAWKKHRVIICKLSLLSSCLGYFFLAVYYLKSQRASP